MRDIKFRMFSKGRNKIISWEELQRLHVHTVFNMLTPECSLMQYTGLKDVNNVEIYEGDIIPFETYKLECIIAEDGVWFENDKLTFRYDDFEKYWESVKVIGNIHENLSCYHASPPMQNPAARKNNHHALQKRGKYVASN